MKRHLAAAVAALAVTAVLVVVPAPSASARGLCWLGICGFVRNDAGSNLRLHFQCADGKWRWLAPGHKSTSKCKDAQKFRARWNARTYRYHSDGNVWMRLTEGRVYEIHDGNDWEIRLRDCGWRGC